MYFEMKRCLWLYIIMSCLAFVACTGDEGLIGSSSQSGFIISIGDEATSDSRTVPAELDKPVAKNFNLFIKSTNSNYVVYEGGYTDQVIPAPAGEFVLTASYGNNSTIAFDEPYYKGSVTAKVVDKETTSVTIPCYVANSLISVEFKSAATFDNYYSSYALRVVVGQSTLELNKDNCEKSIYLPADRSDVKFYLVATPIGGSAQRFDLTDDLAQYLPLAAGDHAKITLTAANFGISVDKVEVVKETVSQTIPLTWLPAPTVTGFDDVEYTETEDIQSTVVKYSGAMAIDDISLAFNFEDAQFTKYNGKTYLLSELTDADCEDLSNLGVSLSATARLATGEIEFKDLIERLRTNAGTATHNTVTVSVKANDRWSQTKTCNINVIKPIFSIEAYPGNIWTKEFTANTLQEDGVETGKYSTILSSVVYQFSYNGTTWTDFTSDMHLENLTPNTSYYIRPVYRGEVPGEVTEVKTYPQTELENGDMENWYEENVTFKRYNMWYPYANDGLSHMWNTLNMETTNGEGASYCSISGTIRTSDKRSGSYAALIRTVGYGVGNTWVGSFLGVNGSIIYNKAIAELYLGTYDDGAKYGTAYESNPTQLVFYYKYTPYGTDNGVCTFSLIGDDGNGNDVTLASTTKDLASASSYTKVTMSMPTNTKPKLKITKLLILFKSGTKTDVQKAQKRDGVQEHFGSQLFVDDISLIYDK
jgi:hypothetical protein